ncbi:glycosyltransferase family 39 protein [Candidatus Berkelbacteria bacterium]|nr:glycosyltransferase family 39 protein [Candidatus Berkelbacteria bacterium]
MVFQKTEALPKLFHFGLGVLAALGTYFFAHRFFDKRISFTAALMLYSLPWLSWLFRTAYIDLGSLFYALLFFWAFYLWFLKKEKPFFYLAALLAGLLFSVKLWNIILLPILLIFILYREGWRLKGVLIFLFLALLPVLPFYIEAFIYTRNPIYPVFSWWDPDHYQGAKNALDWLFNIHPKTFLSTIHNDFFLQTFFLLFAVALFFFPSAFKKISLFFLMGILFVVGWSYIPVHEYRYILPALPPLVLISAFAFEFLKKQSRFLRYFLNFIFLILILFNFAFLFKQNKEYFPVAFGKESRHQFLARKVGGDIWTFYDVDGWFQKNLSKEDRVLVLAHNMFYIDFPYLDGWRLDRELAEVKFKDDFLKLLSKGGFTHIIFKSQVYNWNSFFDLTALKVSPDDSWLKEHFRSVYSNDFTGAALFEIIY